MLLGRFSARLQRLFRRDLCRGLVEADCRRRRQADVDRRRVVDCRVGRRQDGRCLVRAVDMIRSACRMNRRT